MNNSFKAWAGVILIILVAISGFRFANRPSRDPADAGKGSEYDGHLPIDTTELPRYAVDFYVALEDGNAKAVERALGRHPELVKQRFGGETPLHVAARCDQAQLIDLLLQHHADPKSRGEWNSTALHWACWFGSKAAAERLIAHGFDIEDKHNAFGSSPLLWAAHGSGSNSNPKGDYDGTVTLLLAKGASADTRNRDGIPAVAIASSSVAAILRANGARMPATRPSTALTA